MYEQSSNIVKFYVDANKNKEEIQIKSGTRDFSVAEVTVLSCIDALSRHSVYSKEGYDWDVNKVIKMILLGSLYGKMNALYYKDKYSSLIEEIKKGESIESKSAKISVYNTIHRISSGENDKDSVINDLYKNYLKLQTTIRKGHIYWGAKGQRLESILEHIYGTMVILLGIESEYGYCIDFNKIFKMLLLHETEEIKIGDLTDWDISKERKDQLGKMAVKDVLSGLKECDYYIALLDEFNSHKTLESEYAHLCDKMEYDMQVKMYEKQGRYDFEHRPDNVVTRSSSVRKIIEDGANSVFDVHYEYDKNRYGSIPCMRSILELTRNL